MDEMTPAEFRAMLSRAGVSHRVPSDAPLYLSRPQVAERIGVARYTLNRYTLPPADVRVGVLPGWSEATIDAWNAARPSHTVT